MGDTWAGLMHDHEPSAEALLTPNRSDFVSASPPDAVSRNAAMAGSAGHRKHALQQVLRRPSGHNAANC